MPSKSITAGFVENVKPPRLQKGQPPQISYIDTLERGVGLVLVVSYGGTKAFRVLVYRNGKPHTRKLGTYPAMSVKEARAQALAYWKDPTKFEEQAATGSFKEVAQQWLVRHVEANRLRSQPEIERILRTYVYSKWANVKFLDIRRREVNTLLDHIVDHNGPRMADKVLATLSGVMSWFQSRTEDYVSPIVRGMRRNKNRKARDRILDDSEIRALWKACEELGQFGRFLQLCLLTGQRRIKVATMRWDDIADGVWTIRTEAREKGNAGALVLPKLALDILAAQPRLAGNEWVFPGRGGPFHDWARAKRTVDSKLPKGFAPWTIHDLRRSARSLLSRADVRPDIAERVMGHAINGVEGIYDRHQYSQEKADALKHLAALIQTIINPPKGNVVAMKRRRR